MVGTLPPEMGGLRVASVHLDVGDAVVRPAQAKETAARIPTALGGFDVLLAGDFNAPTDSPAMASVRAAGFLDTGADLDPTRIDHIYAHRGAAVEGTDARLVFTGDTEDPVSDHPGVLVTLSPLAVEVPPSTRIVANVDVGFSNFVATRGTLFPDEWTVGWPMHPVAADRWEILLSEVAPGAEFDFKVLRNDADWQTGDDTRGTGGETNETTPTF
jgi:hypothetical protein